MALPRTIFHFPNPIRFGLKTTPPEVFIFILIPTCTDEFIVQPSSSLPPVIRSLYPSNLITSPLIYSPMESQIKGLVAQSSSKSTR